jgi:hypothetical protein
MVNVSQSANSFLRGIFDGWHSPQVHPKSQKSDDLTIPPRKGFVPEKEKNYDALPGVFYPQFGLSTFTKSEKDSNTADRITLSNWR